MRPTIERPELHEARSNQREVIKLVNLMRRRMNDSFTQVLRVATSATGVWSSVLEIPVQNDTVVGLEVVIHARAVSGGAARSLYHLQGLFYREALGAATQEGATASLIAITSVAGMDARFLASANSVFIQVTDDGIRKVDWSVAIVGAEVL